MTNKANVHKPNDIANNNKHKRCSYINHNIISGKTAKFEIDHFTRDLGIHDFKKDFKL